MLRILEWSMPTWMIGLLRPLAQSLPSSASLACAHCGFSIVARKKAGISSYVFEIDSSQPKPLPCKHVVVVTYDGKLSISCAHSRFDELQSHHGSGVVDGTSFTKESLGDA